MYPLLFKIGPLSIHTYGLLVAMGFLAAVSVSKRLAARSRLDVDKILDLTFWGLMVGFLGARILFIITRLDYFLSDPISIFKVWEGGLVFLGGPLLTIPYVLWYCRKHRLPLWKTMDVNAPALAIGQALGRLGCLGAGCCYGKPTGTAFGIRFYSDLVDRKLHGVLLHPTQLYEAGALMALFLGLLYIFKKKVFDGQVALSYLLLYPIIRSIIEIFRGDSIRGFVIEDILSTSQFLSILIFLGAAFVLYRRLQTVEKGRKL